jgi:hypothetical protein
MQFSSIISFRHPVLKQPQPAFFVICELKEILFHFNFRLRFFRIVYSHMKMVE